MTPNNKGFWPLLSKVELNESAVPILLFAYKYGIVELATEISTLKKLAELEWATVHIARGESLCMLTDKGASWIEENFSTLLTMPLYLTYPALVTNDEIQLLEDITSKDSQYRLSGPTVGMDRGRYFLATINNGMITVVDDCDVPYKLNLKATKEILVFRPQQLGTLQAELKKRFHPIRIKSLTKRLCESVPTLTLTEWVEELYHRKHTKDRIGGDHDGRE